MAHDWKATYRPPGDHCRRCGFGGTTHQASIISPRNLAPTRKVRECTPGSTGAHGILERNGKDPNSASSGVASKNSVKPQKKDILDLDLDWAGVEAGIKAIRSKTTQTTLNPVRRAQPPLCHKFPGHVNRQQSNFRHVLSKAAARPP
jgi:Na+-translocating ferredoxin:NAD+ oxidoreductase RNF subunit RnfB